MPVELRGNVQGSSAEPAGHVLDNPVWYSLTGHRSALGRTLTQAARFDGEVSPFAAVCDAPGPQAWAELASLIGASRKTTLFRPPVAVPEPWKVVGRIPCVQMVATSSVAAEDADADVLSLNDVPEMLELVARTQPGPFGPRTIEFGGYIGVRQSGRLVAMAGERLRCGGFTEISAVCTDEDQRGKGLATTLTLALVHRIRARSEEAFLHASTHNVSAIRLYKALGFELRSEVDAFVVESPAEES
jgi:ribosomal protein S18 acetylase RimI-like enzyme